MLDLNSLFENLPLVLVLCCVVPVITLALLGFFVLRGGRRFLGTLISTDLTALNQVYANLRASSPQASTEQLLQRIVRRQAFRSGLVGAITSVGGIPFLPLTLPIDMVLSLRIQAGLAEFIAAVYGLSAAGPEANARNYLIVSGGGRVADATTGILMRWAVRLLGKSFAKLVPVIGAVIGFAVNYAIAYSIGQAALTWYGARAARRQDRGAG
jgi:uncharacterized protein (DUF697 family)